MPRIRLDHKEKLTTPASSYSYSAARIEHLAEVGGADQTLVTILSDVSFSVEEFKAEMERCLRGAVTGIQRWGKASGRDNSVLLRWVTFSSEVEEQHGFRLLSECDPADYRLEVGGTTHLYEAATKANEVTGHYGQRLAEEDFRVNALTIAITDGQEYPGTDPKFRLAGVTASFEALRGQEELDSHCGILVGVNVEGNPGIRKWLADFETAARWDHMVTTGDFGEGTATDLADFIVSSISSTSAAIGSGGASQSIPLTVG